LVVGAGAVSVRPVDYRWLYIVSTQWLGSYGRIVGRNWRSPDAFVLADSDTRVPMLFVADDLEENAYDHLLGFACSSRGCHGGDELERLRSGQLHHYKSFPHRSYRVCVSAGLGMVCGCTFTSTFRVT
jgi:hypothetical protein